MIASLPWSGDPEADRLLVDEPLALLIGFLLDQQILIETAFKGPLYLKQRMGGTLDAAQIAATDPELLGRMFAERPALHRFPGSMAGRVHELCRVISEEYGNDASQVWTSAGDGAELRRRLLALPGIGEMKSKVIAAVLARRLGVRPPGWEKVAADFYSLAEVVDAETLAHYRELKRAAKAEKKGSAPPAAKAGGAGAVRGPRAPRSNRA